MASSFLDLRSSTAAWACLLLATSAVSCHQSPVPSEAGATAVEASGPAETTAQGASPKSLALTEGPNFYSNIPVVQVGYLDSRGNLTIDVPAGVRFTEILADGHFQGKGDIGEDVQFTRLFASYGSRTYVGSQTLKIGSADKKSRSVHWDATELGTRLSRPATGGHDNTEKWAGNGKERVTTPLLTLTESGSNVSLQYREVAEVEKSNEWWSFAVTIRHFY